MSFEKMVALQNWEVRFLQVNLDDLILPTDFTFCDLINAIESYNYSFGIAFYNSCMSSMVDKNSWRLILERLTVLCGIVGEKYCNIHTFLFNFLANLQPYIIKVNEDRDEVVQNRLLEEAYNILNNKTT